MVILKALQRITDKLIELLLVVACIYLAYIALACIIQVFGRYVINSSFPWTEESARFAYLSEAMLGIPIAVRKRRHVKIDLIETKLKGKAKAAQQYIVLVLVAVAAFYFGKEGANLIRLTSGMSSTAMGLPMEFVYYTIPVGGFMSFWCCIMELAGMIFPESLAREKEIGSK